MSAGPPSIVVVVLAVLAAACSPSASDDASCSGPATDVITAQYRTVEGVDNELLSLDVHAANGAENCPIVIWVHGGSWQAGDKDSRLTRVKADHFTESGFVFVSVNYRLASVENDVRWPDFGTDVATATAWVIENANSIGGDAGSVSIMGHSAGAHLVSIVGTNPELLTLAGNDVRPLRCVVSLDSVTHDLTDPPPWEVDIIDLAFPTNEDLIAGSPTLQAAKSAADAPRFLIVTRGRAERIDSSNRLAQVINDAGGSAVVSDVSPYDHGEVSSQLGIDGETVVTPLVDEFLGGCHDAVLP